MSAAEFSATPRVAIVGGGLAGLTAAVGLADRGLHVELFEARRQLGGRATSFRDSESGAWIDHCQHVSLGCCTNLADFCRRTGLDDLIDRHRTLHFFGLDGRRSDVAAARWLPAPLHLLPSLARMKYLSLGERLGIVRALRQLARHTSVDDPHGPTIGKWLRERGQSPRAIEMFWTPVIVSALSETLDRAAVPPVRKVFVDAFLSSRGAGDMLTPRVPLAEFYGERLESWLGQHGVIVRQECAVKTLFGDAAGVTHLEIAGGRQLAFDSFIVATPWRRIGDLLPETLAAALPELREVGQIESAPITAVHLWFDRPITDLPHAVLPGRTSQWFFNRGWQQEAVENATAGHYYQIVISASRDLAERTREQIIAEVLSELASVWPAAGQAKLLQSRVVTDQHAVFSVRPGSEQFRPRQQTSVPNLFLAGDWTATGWPATMEGAVRSGYLAAEGALSLCGQAASLLSADLPRPWLARWL